ncbi:MAG: NAD-dependent epimerase/dehydratase family protein, partial [Gemmataceae bacterium]|nr:NAD-dependent epimerase/dehydratase family protein [Gemmataceae bacterium]
LACRAAGVRRFVHTSSPSVVFDGTDMEGVDESVPYPRHHEAHYPRTKAAAERMVLAANGRGLATVALRPHLHWGPGDNHLVPRLLERGPRLRRIGEGKRIDSVYIDNAAEAHLLAADRLEVGSPIAGRAYFISNGEPLPTWELVDRILAAGGRPPVTRSVSPGLAYLAGWVMEGLWGVFRPWEEPPLTRFVARELATSHWFDIGAARRDLGYEPRVSIDEGMRRLAAWLQRGRMAGDALSEGKP